MEVAEGVAFLLYLALNREPWVVVCCCVFGGTVAENLLVGLMLALVKLKLILCTFGK